MIEKERKQLEKLMNQLKTTAEYLKDQDLIERADKLLGKEEGYGYKEFQSEFEKVFNNDHDSGYPSKPDI